MVFGGLPNHIRGLVHEIAAVFLCRMLGKQREILRNAGEAAPVKLAWCEIKIEAK